MKYIYIVYGVTSEWEDRSEWLVCAFNSKRKANALVKKAQNFASKQKYGEWNTAVNPNPFDPFMQLDYSGTEYGVYQLKLV